MFSAFSEKEWEYYDIFHRDKDYRKEAETLSEKYLKGASRLIEVGSGQGQMTKELERLNYSVTTVDPNYNAYGDDIWDTLPEPFIHCDSVLALYDVCNYMSSQEYARFKKLLDRTEMPHVIEMWKPEDGVRFFTRKKSEGCHRIRLGIRLFGKAHLLFIYWGKGLCLAYHKLYLHED